MLAKLAKLKRRTCRGAVEPGPKSSLYSLCYTVFFALCILCGSAVLYSSSIYAAPNFSITGINQSQGSTAGGQTIVITGEGFLRPVEFAQVSGGNEHACALDFDGQAYCWGDNSRGQLGNDNIGGVHDQFDDGFDSTVPVAVTMPAGVVFANIDTGHYHTCALDFDGQAYCWGHNDYGQLGNGNSANSPIPVRVSQGEVPSGIRLEQVVAAVQHTCAIGSDNKAYCWGRNYKGRLGDNTTDDKNAPVAVVMPAGINFQQIAVASSTTCALTPDSQIYCWGNNDSGQLGDGTSIDSRLTPTASLTPVGATFTQIVAGGGRFCVLSLDGQAYCWGFNDKGQVGDGTANNKNTPTAVAAPAGVGFQQITAGDKHACALTSGNQVYCWGWNESGQLGDGTTTDKSVPTAMAVPAGVGFNRIVADNQLTCALDNTSRVYCWGNNSVGQLGNSTVDSSSTPVLVDVSGLPVRSNVRSVFFGSTSVTSFTVDSSTQITAITPVHPVGVVDVVLTNFQNQSAVLSRGYTYIAGVPHTGGSARQSGLVTLGISVFGLGTAGLIFFVRRKPHYQ